MSNMKLTMVLVMLAFTTLQTNNVCTRNKFIGGPQNTIIKAQELVSSLLQYSNVATTVLYYGKRSYVNAGSGESSVYYVFKIKDISNSENPQRLLIMKITTYQNNTFVDDYAVIPAPDTAVPSTVTYVNNFISSIYPEVDYTNSSYASNGLFFAADANAIPCNVIKEYFTYFYELFGSKFKKNLNN